ncbi:MAG TPA: alpha/beta fold hydrolase [Solirubrobacteraceae bacterium]|nr:alpha/beta fold hydrolase [Solirubrobacteraceae bacterium]
MPVSINHHRAGSGPPLVLVHGVGHRWQTWRPVIDLLSGEFEVLACDVPGFGGSSPLPAGVPRTIGAFADALQGFLAELGIERAHAAGNSMGGGIVLELARRRAVASASVFSPVGFATPRERRYASASLAALRTLHALRPLALALLHTPARRVLLRQLYGYPARTPIEEAVDSTRDLWSSPSFLEALRCLRDHQLTAPEQLRGVPVTIAWGERDRLLLYRRQAPRARARLPWAEHIALGAGHIPFYDDPPACAQVIRSCAARARGRDCAPAAPDGSPPHASGYAPSSAS